MHVHYKFGLFLIFILSVSTRFIRAAPTTNQSSTYDDDYPDDYNDYYDENASDATVSTETINRLKPTITTTPTSLFSKIDIPKRSNHVLEPSCPKACICLEDFKFVQCSNAGLTAVPSDIPSTALIIDLSQNRIGALRANDFANCSKVREINLSNNALVEVNEEAFANLQRLERLRLSHNHLTQLAPDTFAGASELRQLDLSHNPITLHSEGSFLNQPNLLELSCQNCSWNQLYDETFANTSSLTALKLDLNDFNKKINTKAFTPLPNLIKLKLPELDQSSVQELCNLLKSIDNISFKHFDVTCFELVLGASYNESLIQATDPPYLQPATDVQSNSAAPENTRNSNRNAQKMAEHASSNLTMTRNDGGDNTLSAGILGDGKPTTATNSGDDNKAYQVPISQETINIMLICIMVIAVIGIIIGIICRKDVGGIKTKCCRTRKPEPKDQVHPTEEIPLNKLA